MSVLISKSGDFSKISKILKAGNLYYIFHIISRGRGVIVFNFGCIQIKSIFLFSLFFRIIVISNPGILHVTHPKSSGWQHFSRDLVYFLLQGR